MSDNHTDEGTEKSLSVWFFYIAVCVGKRLIVCLKYRRKIECCGAGFGNAAFGSSGRAGDGG